MNSLTDILEALEAELALERELGLRSVEFDRSLLKAASQPSLSQTRSQAGQTANEPTSEPAPKPPAPVKDTRTAASPKPEARVPLAFIHHRPLPPVGREMVSKILAALGLGAGEAPLIEDPSAVLPEARIYVMLGALALRQRFPAKAAAPNQWLRGEKGECILVTYSPEYFLRFADASAVRQMKRDMWAALQDALRRARNGNGLAEP